MLNGAHSGFHRSSQIMLIVFVCEMVFRALRYVPLCRGKVNEITRVSLLGPGTTTFVKLERTSGTSLGLEACEPAERSSAARRQCRLAVGTSQESRMAVFILFLLKIRKVEELGIGLLSTNTGLNETNFMFA